MRWWKINGNSITQTAWEHELVPQKRATWVTRKPPKLWAVGDGVFCWRSGKDQGFVGLAQIEHISNKPNLDGLWHYRLVYLTAPFAKPLGLADLRESFVASNVDSWLKSMLGVVEVYERDARLLGAAIVAQNPEVAPVIAAWMPSRDIAHPLHDTCVYAVIDPANLLASARSGGELHDKTRWVAIEKLWNARPPGHDIAVLFADVASAREIVYWARLDNLRVDESGTRYRVRNLCWASGHARTDLRQFSDEAPIQEHHVRPYAVCQTPNWLPFMAGGAVTSVAGQKSSIAQELFERILPEQSLRHRVLRRLADAIAIADEAGGEWGVTLRERKYLRLNVGNTEFFVTGENGWANVLVDPLLVPSKFRRCLGTRPYPSAGGAPRRNE
jgi:hypothetical protein